MLRGGLGALAITVASAAVLASGCIFDDGSGYQGGGRRTGAPTATDDQGPAPTRTSTPPSTSSATSSGTPSDAGSLPQDAGAG